MAGKKLQAGVSLQMLLADLAAIKVDVAVSMLSLDARKVENGGLFLAVAGSVQHGLRYASQAVAQGASAIVFDPSAGGELLALALKGKPVVLVAVKNLAQKVSEIAGRFYASPSHSLAVVGITGTNGKTSVSHYLAQALSNDKPCAVVGTLGWGLLGELVRTSNTTPDAVSVQRHLAAMKKDDIASVAMEVSSHGLEQGRVADVQFAGAVFTNLSHDHLDYHGSMAAYGQAKQTLFCMDGLQFAVLNLDDSFSQKIREKIDPAVTVFGVSRQSNFDAKIKTLQITAEKCSSTGVQFTLQYGADKVLIKSPLLGRFNIDNIASTIAVQLGLGLSFDKAVANCQKITAVAGRMQQVLPQGLACEMPGVVIDFAHTPAALDAVLMSLRESAQAKLTVVFGCGGDRDQLKRPEMGRIAAKYANQIVLTADNPRSESAESIVQQIKQGMAEDAPVIVETDRQKAIHWAIANAGARDVVLIAGKGHETYQQIGAEKLPFSDADCAEKSLRQIAQSKEAACKK